jgi:hypothetical protein
LNLRDLRSNVDLEILAVDSVDELGSRLDKFGIEPFLYTN